MFKMDHILPYLTANWFRNVEDFRTLCPLMHEGQHILGQIENIDFDTCENSELRFFNIICQLSRIVYNFEVQVSNLVFDLKFRTRSEKRAFEALMGILCEFYNLLLDGGNIAFSKVGIVHKYASPYQFF